MKSPSRLLLFWIMCLAYQQANAQQNRSGLFQDSAGQVPGFAFKVRLAYSFGGGASVAAGFGFWKSFGNVDLASNFALNAFIGRKYLGNRDRCGDRTHLNFSVTPMLTVGRKRSRYEEINTFYYGVANSVYSEKKYAITLGTTFVTMPKGLGLNIMTPRNRSQQLILLHIRADNFRFSAYEDFLLTDYLIIQAFADNRDRFYTGGLQAQYRVNENLVLGAVSEAYTGTSEPDRDDFPDREEQAQTTESGYGPKRAKTYAYQTTAQTAFNTGRNFITAEITPNASANGYYYTEVKPYVLTSYEFYFGFQGLSGNMWQQKMIHSQMGVGRNIPNGTSKTTQDRLHFFQADQLRDKAKMSDCPTCKPCKKISWNPSKHSVNGVGRLVFGGAINSAIR